MNILIAGGTGLIGSRLLELLDHERHNVTILSRRKREDAPECKYVQWSPSDESINLQNLDNYDAIINLAGAGIADKRWTANYKKIILDSRIQSARTLEKYLRLTHNKPSVYIGASAIGIYGDQGDKKLLESDEVGQGFLADVTKEWETAHRQIESLSERTVLLRIGIVLSTLGGALKEIIKPAQVGMYGYFGDGSAYYSWIHIDDMCKIIIESMENANMQGVYNATNPEPVTIKKLVKSVKRAKGGFGLAIPVPAISLKTMLGEMSQMLLNSTRVIPQRLMDANFKFDHNSLVPALKDLLSKKI